MNIQLNKPSGFRLVITIILLGVAVVLGLIAPARAEDFRYQYVDLGDKVPPNSSLFSFFIPSGINDHRQVAGTVFFCDAVSCVSNVAIYESGNTKLIQAGNSGPINIRGMVGGNVVIDPVNFFNQAAIFHDNTVNLIPPQPAEITSTVIGLNDKNVALIRSVDSFFSSHSILYNSKGQASLIDFGPTITSPSLLALNNEGFISGTTGSRFSDAKAFRFDQRTGAAELLEPQPTEPLAWGLGINNQGNVLGYSFVSGGLERIGLWDRTNIFRTYFVEGTPVLPTVSNKLVFNDKNQIVITRVSRPAADRFSVSYLLPKPSVRLNIADLVVNLPPGVKIGSIEAINNQGDMIGFDIFSGEPFLLKRIDEKDMQALAITSPSAVKTQLAINGQIAPPKIPPEFAARINQYLPALDILK